MLKGRDVMTNNELNQFILHYLVEDKTHSAIMLTGAWGTGKSYYIQNELVPFLKEEHEKECVTVSLYGIKSTAEISRSIYIELRAKTLSAKGEAAVAGKLIAKTIVRGVVSRFGIDFSKENDTMQELYESINLSNKLVILEDIERSQIEVIELLGYVNSLVEQDNVKVLLVANENEMLKYNGDAKELPLFEQEWSDEEGGSHSLKHPLRKYLTVKEKTVSDTIQYTGDYEGAVSQIIKSFGNPILDKFANDSSVKTICGFMDTFKHNNLRSFIFACQKCADILEMLNAPYGDDFIECIYFGIICFTFRFKGGRTMNWDGGEHYSIALGCEKFPLFKFCFEYITQQKLDVGQIPEAERAYAKMRLYDKSKTISDADLQTLFSYHLHYESDVQNAVQSISDRLLNIGDISFYDYGAIAVYAIIVQHQLGIDIADLTNRLVDNLNGQGAEFQIEEIFRVAFDSSKNESMQEEYKALHQRMMRSLNSNVQIFPGFEYLPEQADSFYNYVIQNEEKYILREQFAKSLDVERLAEMFFKSNPQQKDCIRGAFITVYRLGNIGQYLSDDATVIEELCQLIEKDAPKQTGDRVQALQYRFFIDNLKQILEKLQ